MNYEETIERRGLPGNIPAERTVLGQLMVHLPTERPLLEESLLQLNMEMFALDSHQRIYEAIWHITRDGGLPDVSLVSQWLTRKQSLESVGGMGYVLSLTESLPRHVDITNYVSILREDAQRRALLSTVETYAAAAVPSTSMFSPPPTTEPLPLASPPQRAGSHTRRR